MCWENDFRIFVVLMTAEGMIQDNFTGVWNFEKFSNHMLPNIASVGIENIVGRFLGLQSDMFLSVVQTPRYFTETWTKWSSNSNK